ncbi:MAG: isochorismate synthase [Cyanothece sp. SIO2G6]|nr:isochorismate synthase [Cyanothece sp. SIO2G6]
MSILNQVEHAFKYLWEGTTRIFGPDDNTYPETGVQPFSGDPYDQDNQQASNEV